MGFTIRENMVRVDFFKPNGKWYAAEEVEFRNYENWDIYEEFAKALAKALVNETLDKCRYDEMVAVCLEPYNKFSHPLMVPNVGKFLEEKKHFLPRRDSR